MDNQNQQSPHLPTIIKFIEHLKGKDIDLYWNEVYIGKELALVMARIKADNYSYGIDSIEESLSTDSPSNFEINCMLYILDQYKFLERGTSIRFWWIEHDIRDVFDLFLELLQKEPRIVSLSHWYMLDCHSGMMTDFDKDEADTIKYITDILAG